MAQLPLKVVATQLPLQGDRGKGKVDPDGVEVDPTRRRRGGEFNQVRGGFNQAQGGLCRPPPLCHEVWCLMIEVRVRTLEKWRK